MQFISLQSGSAGNAYLVRDCGASLLIEAGLPLTKLKQKVWDAGSKLSDLSAVCVSHSHGDHAMSVKKIQFDGIDAFMSDQTAANLDIVTSHRTHILEPLEWRILDDGYQWQIQAFPLDHDRNAEGNMGFHIIGPSGDRLVYMTDYRFSRFLLPAGVTVLALACNYDIDILNRNVAQGSLHPDVAKRTIEAHPSIEMVIGLLESNKENLLRCHEINLLHLSAGNADPADFKRRVEAATGIPTRIATG